MKSLRRPDTATIVATATAAFLIGNAWHDSLATKKLATEKPIIDPIEKINGIESGSSLSFPLKGLAMRLQAYKAERNIASKKDICFTPACVPGESKDISVEKAEPSRPVAGEITTPLPSLFPELTGSLALAGASIPIVEGIDPGTTGPANQNTPGAHAPAQTLFDYLPTPN